MLTSSPYVTAFSSFPPPPEVDSWSHWTHDQFQLYLEAYADHFSLWKHIRLNTTVNAIRPADHCGEPCGAQLSSPAADSSSEKDRFWCIESTTRSGKEENRTEFFDNVAVCTGLNQYLRNPEIKGLERFKGDVIHSSDIKDAKVRSFHFYLMGAWAKSDLECISTRLWLVVCRFGGQVMDNKKIVVIGFGESSVDVAAEAGKRGQKSYLSFRRGKLIIPRKNPLNNLANDFDTNRLRYSAPTWVRNLIMLVRRRICARAGHGDPSAIVRAYFLDTVRSCRLFFVLFCFVFVRSFLESCSTISTIPIIITVCVCVCVCVCVYVCSSRLELGLIIFHLQRVLCLSKRSLKAD